MAPLIWLMFHNNCLPPKVPRSRPQPHRNKPSPLLLSPIAPRHPTPLITLPSPPDVIRAKMALSTPRVTHPRNLLNTIRPRVRQSLLHRALPPLLALRLMTACSRTRCLPSTLGPSLVPPGPLPDQDTDPACHLPHSLHQMMVVMESLAPPPRS